MTDRSDILFVGWGGPEGVTHYRTILPAKTMGAEYVVFDMNGRPVCGDGHRTDHRVIVVQNCWYEWQLKIIQRMKASGAMVLFNVDDWIKGIARREGSHGHAKLFGSGSVQKTHDRIWSLCDGAIVSTEWIAQKVQGLNPNVEVARNGIDPGRYRTWADPERDLGIIIGWAGGTGHREALASISSDVSKVVNEHSNVSLWIVGQDESDLFSCPTHYVEWSDMYLYPAQLACFDISLAPALENDFYRGKSQLRLYEAMTLGTPSIVSPLYDEIGKAGMVADGTHYTWEQCLRTLVEGEEGARWRKLMRENALEQSKEVTIDARIHEWTTAIDKLTS